MVASEMMKEGKFMKRMMSILLAAALLLGGCGAKTDKPVVEATTENPTEVVEATEPEKKIEEIAFQSRFAEETAIQLSDDGITVNGGGETEGVYTSRDIVYYEEKTAYDSGNPYGDGSEADMHSVDEAAGHLVVNITQPGAYRISGKLSAGQIRVDLGATAYEDETAVVELVLENADITCTVAPAILFKNVYECDGAWSVEEAKAEVDTSKAGAVLVLEGENLVNGSYVAKIYKDAEGEKKLCKQDGAIYSYMSLNVFGPGSLDLTAENEGLDSELHLTINGGKIAIRSCNDGINTNEDGVSVTTINGGDVHIIAGLGQEGDGIDSNGYLVINGGTVVSTANPVADAGLDSDLGSYVNGGIVVALGSTMDWAESDSNQVTMNLQFADYQSSDSAIVVTGENDEVVFVYDPAADEVLGENVRRYQGAVISTPNLTQGQSYHVYVGGSQMMYTGTDVGFGGFGGFGPGKPGEMPEGFEGQIPEEFKGHMPENFQGQMPNMENFTVPEGGEMPEGFENWFGQFSEGMDENFAMPENWNGEGAPERGEKPEGFDGQMPGGFGGPMPGGFGGQQGEAGEGSTVFFMSDKVNAFSGVTAVTE